MSTSTEVAPTIAADTYAGTWTRTIRRGAHRADTFTAQELATMHSGAFCIWESAGSATGGAELFCRTRFVPQADGSLAGYDANGRLIIVHPAARPLRILTK